MKLIKLNHDAYVFRLTRREKQLLFSILKLYPLLPLSHHRVRQKLQTDKDREAQALLEESMKASTQENRTRLAGLLSNPRRFVADESGWRFTLPREEAEWLLQVLNDVRVGSWLIVGSPDPDEGKLPKVSPDTARYLLAMDLSAHFECELLEAIDAAGAD